MAVISRVLMNSEDFLSLCQKNEYKERDIKKFTLALAFITEDLKDKKREKVLETVKGLTEEYLREFVNKHNELNDGLISLEKEINGSDVLKSENKFNYELSNLNDNLENVNSEILVNEQELSKINIREMKSNLGKEINELLKTDVVIS